MPAYRRIGAVDVQVGQRIRTARLTQGVSQQKVAEALGVTFQQVQKYENGMNRVGMGRLHAIANSLGLPMSYFFEGLDLAQSAASPNTQVQAINAAFKTKEGVRVAAALSCIHSPSLRRHIADLLEAIIARDNEERPLATESRHAPPMMHVGDPDDRNHRCEIPARS
jgi:transcriptional regulator with XRE-family HTH domain